LESNYTNAAPLRQRLGATFQFDIRQRIACPVHQGSKWNLAFYLDDHGRLRASCKSHGCDEREIWRALGQPGFLRNVPTISINEHRQGHEIGIRNANELWRNSRPAAGTIVETYLRSRGLRLPIRSSIRFAPSIRHAESGYYLPAMIAAVETEAGLVAVQRTYLRSDGSGKATVTPNKKTLGPIYGGAVRLAPAAERIVIAEGVETSLSVQQVERLPAWAALGSTNLKNVKLPAIVREVMLAADNDRNGTGEQAARIAAHKFICQGRRAWIALPPEDGTDWNDVLRRCGR
jgi:putative DNA primase/helicase